MIGWSAGGRIVAAVVCVAAVGLSGPAVAAPPAPRPTSTAASPEAPDPNPPLGGIGPDGKAVGGRSLLSRDVVVPAGAPPLPAGLTAQGWALTDLDTGAVLAARDAHGRYQPASVLKVLTSLVLLPKLPGSQIVTASAAAAGTEGSAVGLVAGGQYSVDVLFQSLLLMSGNDAATALAEAAGGVPATVAAMNAATTALGAYDTFVETPSGLDGWQQLTSAYDLSLVLRAAVNEPRLLAYDQASTATLPPQSVGAKSWGPVPLYNQSANFLTTVPGAILAKTGYTDAALHTYMCAAERGGRRLGVVFLRAQRAPTDQWQQAATLLDWGYALPAGADVGPLVNPRAANAGNTPSPASSSSRPSSPSRSSGAAAAARRSANPATAAAAGGFGASEPGGRGSGVSGRALVNSALIALTVIAAGLTLLQHRRRRRP